MSMTLHKYLKKDFAAGRIDCNDGSDIDTNREPMYKSIALLECLTPVIRIRHATRPVLDIQAPP